MFDNNAEVGVKSRLTLHNCKAGLDVRHQWLLVIFLKDYVTVCLDGIEDNAGNENSDTDSNDLGLNTIQSSGSECKKFWHSSTHLFCIYTHTQTHTRTTDGKNWYP